MLCVLKDEGPRDRCFVNRESLCCLPLSVLLASVTIAGCAGTEDEAPLVTGTSSSAMPSSGPGSGVPTSTGASGAQGGSSASSDSTGGGSSTGSGSSAAPAEIDLRIQFEAKVGQATFACGQTFGGVGSSNSEIDPVDFRFYVHNLRLVDLQGQEVPVSIPDREMWQAQGVALLDFESDAGSCRFGGDAGLNKIVNGSVPQGQYRGLRFTLGVPASINHQDPLSLGALFQSGGMQWNWLTGFKFLALEFRSGERSGLLHVGSTACTGGGPKAVECSKSNRAEVSLPTFEPGVSRIAADLGAVFANSDLQVDQICHSDGESCSPMFTQAGLAWDSGASLAVQSFFSVLDPASP